MKKTAVTVIAVLFATLSFAQKMEKRNIPVDVKSSFQLKYPTAAKIKWDKEGENYEASFDLDKTASSVLMDAKGTIIETEIEIELSQLPKGILNYVKTHYAGKHVKEGAKITDAKGIIKYEVELQGIDLIFDNNGKFIKEIKY